MNSFLSFQVHGNTDSHEGAATYLDALLTFLASLLDKSASDIFSAFFPGIVALENAHPLLVHFPIAFLTGFFFLDVMASLTKKSHWYEFASGLLYLGTVSALFTVIAGFIAANSIAHGDNVHAIMERHELFGVIILSLSALLSVWRWKFSQHLVGEQGILFRIVSALLFLFLILGADLGGLMVYQYGVAVKAVSETQSQSYQQHLHNY